MSDHPALSAEETAALIDYARQKYAEERWPLARELQPVRQAIEKLRGQRAKAHANVEAKRKSAVR